MKKIEKAKLECEEWLATTTIEWTPIAMQKKHCEMVFKKFGIKDAKAHAEQVVNNQKK